MVAAAFELAAGHPARAVLAEQALGRTRTCCLRRQLGTDGRGRAFVNDQPVSVALLRRLGDTLVEIQGQFEQHGLLDTATHRASLDAFAGPRGAGRRGARRLARLAGRRRARARSRGRRRPRRGATRISCATRWTSSTRWRPESGDERRWPTSGLLLTRRIGQAVSQALGELGRPRRGRGPAARRTGCRAQRRQGGRAPRLRAGGARPRTERSHRGAGPARTARRRWSSIPTRAGADRGAAVRAARRGPQARRRRRRSCAAGRELRRSWPRSRTARRGCCGSRRKPRPARAAYLAAAAAQAARAPQGAARLDAAVAGELGPLRLDKARFVTRSRRCRRPTGRGGHRSRRQFEVATNPGAPPAPLAPHRLGRRAVALPAGAQGVPGQGRRRPDHRVRRGRFRHRRRHGRRRRRAPAAAGARRPGAGGDALAAGGGAGRPALADRQDRRRAAPPAPTSWCSTPGAPRGDRPHAVGRAGHGGSARRRRPAAARPRPRRAPCRVRRIVSSIAVDDLTEQQARSRARRLVA